MSGFVRVGEAGSAIVTVVVCMLPGALASGCSLSKGMEFVGCKNPLQRRGRWTVRPKIIKSRLGSARTQMTRLGEVFIRLNWERSSHTAEKDCTVQRDTSRER